MGDKEKCIEIWTVSKGEITAGSPLSQCLAYWRSVAFERVYIYMLALIESCVPRETQAAVKV